MNRRSFLSLFGSGIAGIALEHAIPLGRVWSFPKEIVIPKSTFDFSENYTCAMQALNRVVDEWNAKQETIVIREIFSPHPSGFRVKKLEWRRADGTWERLGPSVLTAAFPPDSSRTPS
jgi:hypothetical protein